MIPADDRGLTLGDGLFETVLALSGRLVDWDAHLQRMAAGCQVLGLPAPDAAGADQLARAALAAAGLGEGRAAVRLTLTAGSGGRGLDRPQAPAPRMFATAAPAPAPAAPARLVTAAVRRNADSPASRLKTLAYLDNVLAREEARAAGADEAVMLNTRGELACAAAANLFWIRQGRLETPDLACGVLAGVMRARVLAAAARLGVAATEVRAPEAVLEDAEAVFLTNSLIGVRPVAAWNGRSFPASPLVDRLAAAA
ncbi:aminotransferase class IV [Phenylobacterium terrae]|uniref:Probable branched-chain-amino-acid aminotransferase n=1 Tax=Phenylobacterium terrae TaxID=2665495 RepID=A0ABW4N106_9CAUL